MYNKSMIRNIMRGVVAFLLILIALIALFAPIYTVKVSIQSDSATPYDARISFNAISYHAVMKDFNQLVTGEKEFDDLTRKDQSRLLFVYSSSSDFEEYLDEYEAKDSDITGSSLSGVTVFNGSMTSPSRGLNETYKFSVYFILFIVCAILVGIINNKASYILSIIVTVVFGVKCVGTIISMDIVGMIERSVDDLDFTFYNARGGSGYYFAIIFMLLIVCAASYAISLNNGPKPYSMPAQPPMPAPMPAQDMGSMNSYNAASAQGLSHSIICLRGELMGGTFAIGSGETIVIGRDGSVANIVVVAPKISRKHCSVRYDGIQDCYMVIDYSTNGTFNAANGQRLAHNSEVRVPVGTVLSLGNGDNQFRLN